MVEQVVLLNMEKTSARKLKAQLKNDRFEVRSMSGGKKLLQLIPALKNPLIVAGVADDSLNFLKTLEEMDYYSEVIMLFNPGDDEYMAECLKHDVSDCIPQPISLKILHMALKRARNKIYMRQKLDKYQDNVQNLTGERAERILGLERYLSVSQIIESLSTFVRGFSMDFDTGAKYLNELPCFISLHNTDNKVLFTNTLYRRRLGNKVGCNSWDIYKGKPGKPNHCPVARTIKQNRALKCNASADYINEKDRHLVVHTAPIRNHKGKIELVLEMSADVREIKKLAQDLEESRRKYQQLFDESPCYIYVQDKDFRITETNRKFKEKFGDEIGALCYSVYKDSVKPCPECPVIKTYEDGKSHPSESVITSKKGEKYNVYQMTAPLRDENGDITKVMVMFTDITEIRRLQDHLTSLGLMIGSISHGIKGLLTGLDGGMYLMDSGFQNQNPDDIKEGWEVVKLMVERIRGLVIDILYYAKSRDLEWESIDVNSLVSEISFILKSKMLSKSINFICRFDDNLGNFEVDPGIVRSAMINILENALDACAFDSMKTEHQITFDVSRGKNHIVFRIEDNGMGMDEETRKNMFSIFFSSKGNKGTGLGLFISNKVILQHMGSITVDSSEGTGTRFCIRIPIQLPDSIKYRKNRLKKNKEISPVIS